MTEQKEKKYTKVYGKSVKLQLGESTALIVQKVVSTRIEDGKEFHNVNLVSGYEGSMGFKPQRFNAILQLPLGLTREFFQELANAYESESK